MAILERDVALQGEDPVTGQPTIDLPFTRAGNIENSAERVTSASENDSIPIFTPDGVYMKTIAVRDLFNGRSSSRTSIDVKSCDITIPSSASSWTADVIESYEYYIDIPVDDIRAIHHPDIILDISAHTVASKAGMCSTVESFDGFVRFRSRDIPESDITGVCTFIDVGSESENVTQYDLRIPDVGWSNDNRNTVYPYVITLDFDGIVGSQRPTAILDVASQSEARACGLCPTVETLDDGLRFRTKTIPTKALTGICYLVG